MRVVSRAADIGRDRLQPRQRQCIEHAAGLCRHLGADPVPGQNRDFHESPAIRRNRSIRIERAAITSLALAASPRSGRRERSDLP